MTFMRPKSGLAVVMPDGSTFPAAGSYADPADPFIRRRLADGDLILADDPAATPAKPAKGS
jgi:hypothetical protein